MCPVYTEIADIEMKESANNLRLKILEEEYKEDLVCDISVSCDGTWQRRGYSSLNGVVSAISVDTGRCLAYDALVKTENRARCGHLGKDRWNTITSCRTMIESSIMRGQPVLWNQLVS